VQENIALTNQGSSFVQGGADGMAYAQGP